MPLIYVIRNRSTSVETLSLGKRCKEEKSPRIAQLDFLLW
jgi:hypothetical protein